MSETRHFSFLGVGNGFADGCLPRYDVNDVLVPGGIGYVAWTFAQAMKVYWNFESMTVNAKEFPSFIPNALEKPEPYQRVCGNSITSMVRLYDGATTDEDNFLGYAWGSPEFSGTEWLAATLSEAPDFEQVVLSSYEVGIWATDTVETFNGIDFYVSAGSAPTDSIDNLTFFTYPT
jgi:hypothetical protein